MFQGVDFFLDVFKCLLDFGSPIGVGDDIVVGDDIGGVEDLMSGMTLIQLLACHAHLYCLYHVWLTHTHYAG